MSDYPLDRTLVNLRKLGGLGNDFQVSKASQGTRPFPKVGFCQDRALYTRDTSKSGMYKRTDCINIVFKEYRYRCALTFSVAFIFTRAMCERALKAHATKKYVRARGIEHILLGKLSYMRRYKFAKRILQYLYWSSGVSIMALPRNGTLLAQHQNSNYVARSKGWGNKAGGDKIFIYRADGQSLIIFSQEHRCIGHSLFRLEPEQVCRAHLLILGPINITVVLELL